MTLTKVFFRKTKRGNVLKTVRQHYLQSDIPCGADFCTECSKLGMDGEFYRAPVLSFSPTYKTSLFKNAPIIIPDTNVVLHQIDFLEHSTITNVVILSTVLDEAKHRSLKTYKRLRECISNHDKRFFTFVNQFHKDTYVERRAKESSNDWNDRMVRSAVKWYKKHLSVEGEGMDVVLLTDDRENRKLAIQEGIQAFTVRKYVSKIEKGEDLMEILFTPTEDMDTEQNNHKEIYPEHLHLSELQKGLKLGSLMQGSFQACRDNCLEAFVNVHDEDKQIFIKGRTCLNRAINEDIVAVRLFPKKQWSHPSSLVVEDVEGAAEEGEVTEEPTAKSARIPTGEVVGIIKRNWRQYCGVLQKSIIKGLSRHLFMPAERRIPCVRIETRQSEQLCGQRIIVVVDAWPRNSRYPQGHLVRRLGEVGDREVENEVLLIEHDVPHATFSKEVLACLPTLPWIITDKDMEGRMDLREMTICSVDPPGCTDIDDALHCRQIDGGLYEIGVHIADVSHFIRSGTALDKEAALRGTTVYLIDKRIDMVPDRLSTNLCSLRANEERFAFSVIWKINREAEVLDVKFTKTLIKSRAALTYAEAQMRIDDPCQTDEVAQSLRRLNSIAKILRRKRIANGALSLASPEIRFHIDSETHDPIDVQAKELKETNWMVEEFMLLANTSTATHTHLNFPSCSLLRRHPSPPLNNFEPLIKVAKQKGFKLDVSSGKALADSLEGAIIPAHPYFNVMLRILATRCMMQAVYFSSGSVVKDDYHHYGLASPIYTHFTSPIRRYSDIQVHRLLAVVIGAEKAYADLMDKNKTQSLCNNLNFRHRMAQYAGRASVALYTQIFFKNQLLDEQGYVLFVKKNALQILIPKYGLEGNVFLDRDGKKGGKGGEGGCEGVYDDEKNTQTFGSVVINAFDEVIVQVSINSSNIQHQKMALKLVKPQIKGLSVPAKGVEPMQVD